MHKQALYCPQRACLSVCLLLLFYKERLHGWHLLSSQTSSSCISISRFLMSSRIPKGLWFSGCWESHPLVPADIWNKGLIGHLSHKEEKEEVKRLGSWKGMSALCICLAEWRLRSTEHTMAAFVCREVVSAFGFQVSTSRKQETLSSPKFGNI